jgi:hypothetical protein
MDFKKAYYYVICLAALFVLMWGVVDLASASIGLSTARLPSTSMGGSSPEKESEPTLDIYYQRKMLYDRLFDSLARIVVSGLVFTFCRFKVDRLEK